MLLLRENMYEKWGDGDVEREGKGKNYRTTVGRLKPVRPTAVREARQSLVSSSAWLWLLCSSGVCPGIAAIRRIRGASGSSHQEFWSAIPAIRRRHAAVFVYENQWFNTSSFSTYYVRARRRCMTGISQTVCSWTPTKSDVILLGSANQLRLAASVDSVEVAGVTLTVASTLKSEVTRHHSGPATHVRRPCNGRSKVLQLPHSGDQACSPSLARVCGSDVSVQLNQQSTRLLHFATARSSIIDCKEDAASTEQRSSCGTCSKSPLLRQLHWLPVRQCVLYKMAVLTRKTRTSGV